MLAIWQGTAFDTSYIIAAFATLIVSAVMIRTHLFGRITAYTGILAGLLMLVPASAGTIGLLLSFLSVVPYAVWLVLIAKRLLLLAQSTSKEEMTPS